MSIAMGWGCAVAFIAFAVLYARELLLLREHGWDYDEKFWTLGMGKGEVGDEPMDPMQRIYLGYPLFLIVLGVFAASAFDLI